MSLYTYKAVGPDGRSIAGRIDALNIVDLETVSYTHLDVYKRQGR